MKHVHLRTIIIFGTTILIGLLVIQVYWLKRAFDTAEKQFDHVVQMALKRVGDSVANEPEVKKLSSNFFLVVANSQLDDTQVDTMVRREFLSRKLDVAYELGIYNAADDTLVYGHYVKATGNILYDDAVSSVKSAATKNFAVYFPEKKSYIAAELDVWIFSTIVLLLMMGFFAYAIASLLREKRFSDLKNDFINNMTHEFKTPVTNIAIAAEILSSKLNDLHSKSYLDILVKENEKLRTKIEQILHSATADHLKNISLEVMDLHKLIADCAEAFQLKIQQRQGTIHLEFNAKNSSIAGDRELLMHAIGNVIDNAEKYSSGRPHIIVKTVDTRNGIEINVIDDGIGIPENMISKVFGKFFRVQTGAVHNVKGFGLGLSFAYNVVRLHKGRISLFSTLNKGTDVRIVLPAL